MIQYTHVRKVLVTSNISQSLNGPKLWDCGDRLGGKLLNNIMLYRICHYWIKNDLSKKSCRALVIWVRVDKGTKRCYENFVDASVHPPLETSRASPV